MKMLLTSIQKIIMMLTAMLTPSCEVITRKISESMDHKLSFYDRVRIRIHNFGCHLCERYQRQLQLMHDALEQMKKQLENDDDLRLPEDAKNRIKEKLGENR